MSDEKGFPAVCDRCGAVLPSQKTGRPRQYCDKCFLKHRQLQKHERYRKRKYPDSNETERLLLELKAQLQVDVNAVKNFKQWFKHYCSQRDLSALFSDLDGTARKRTCQGKRVHALRLLAEHELKGLACAEPLWQPKKKQLLRTC